MDPGALNIAEAPSADALVSVVIPCYRQAHFLGQAIESVLSQTHPRRETVVVDDGSPDNTREVAAQFPDVVYVRQSNQGLSAARNTGARYSKGQFLVFLDADDRLTPDSLAIGLDGFRAHPECAMVSGHWRYLRLNGTREADFPQLPLVGEPYLTLLERNYIGMNAAVMHRRAAFEAIGGFDTSLESCEDYELYMRMARAYPVFSHSAILAEYRSYDHSMSKQPSLMMQGVLDVFRAQWQFVTGNVAYLEAFRSGLFLNSKNAYWPALGVAKRTLKRGNIPRAVWLGFKAMKRPTLLFRAFLLDRQAAKELARCQKLLEASSSRNSTPGNHRPCPK